MGGCTNDPSAEGGLFAIHCMRVITYAGYWLGAYTE